VRADGRTHLGGEASPASIDEIRACFAAIHVVYVRGHEAAHAVELLVAADRIG
jgi:hypothetical protein